MLSTWRPVPFVSLSPEIVLFLSQNPKFAKPSDRDRLPQFRGIAEETEMGFVESEEVPEGKLSLRQSMKILTDHQQNPLKYNANTVASQYKIPVPVAGEKISS